MTVVDEPVHSARCTTTTPITAWVGSTATHKSDLLAVEEPLEIRLAGWSVAVTMRTPGHDFDLAVGFLHSEGILPAGAAIASIAYCPSEEAAALGNIVNINPVDPDLVEPEKWNRNFFMTSSCGVCGQASIVSVRRQVEPAVADWRIDVDALYAMGETLKHSQDVFAGTGGLHAAALFDQAGRLLVVREDVGRHNAVDKVIGYAVCQGWGPLSDCILVVTSRGSFEIVQKALVARIPVVATVSAPSSLAVELACSCGLTLVGFLRAGADGSGRCNVYAGAERIEHQHQEKVG